VPRRSRAQRFGTEAEFHDTMALTTCTPAVAVIPPDKTPISILSRWNASLFFASDEGDLSAPHFHETGCGSA
jgi:hypothetical protein